jgi:hypothetical protein
LWRGSASVGGCATRVHAFDEDAMWLLTEDVAGIHLDDIIVTTHEQGASLDPSVLFAILGPVAAILGESDVPADADPWNIHVGFDGVVRFDGFLTPWLPLAGAASLSPVELAENLLLGGVLGPPVPHLDLTPYAEEPYELQNERTRRHRVQVLTERAQEVPGLGPLLAQIVDADRTLVSRRTLAAAVARWGETLPPAPPGALRELIRGLFPSRVAAEENLREQLALLDDASIAVLLRHGPPRE